MSFAEQLKAALGAVQFHSRLTYSWFGTSPRRAGRVVPKALAPERQRRWVLNNLQAQLYRDFYCPGLPVAAGQGANQSRDTGITDFVRQLSEANTGKGCVSEGWNVQAFHAGDVTVEKGGLQLWVRRQDCLLSNETRIEPGASLALHFPKGLPDISPGFYVACAEKELVHAESEPLVRLYWNVTAEGAIRFVRHATSALNIAGAPFKIKALNDPASYKRCDAVVLYIRKLDYLCVSALLESIYQKMIPALKSAVPALTKQLAPGVGLAEDPGQGESYGSHRCRIVAEGLIRVYERRKTAIEEQLQLIRECFEENGINWETPFLTSSMVDDYDFLPRAVHGKRRADAAEERSEAYLRIAAEIGERLVQAAIWHYGRCNWMGLGEGVPQSTSSRAAERYSALSSEVYSGTSGIALFLAELYRVTGYAEARRCGLGAIRQALAHLDAPLPETGLGFYTGWTGVAFAAARIGMLLGEDRLLNRGRQLIKKVNLLSRDERRFEFDFLSGKAGAIAALIMIWDLVGDEFLLDFAVRLGDELLRSAHVDAYGGSWRSLSSGYRQNLTGFAHGAAGVAFALVELFRATGDSRYRKTAEQSFDYERHWFNAAAGNWPDFREFARGGGRSRPPLRFSTTWCHGAPGIALSRLRAYEVFKEPRYKTEAIAALQTTCRSTKGWLNSGTGDYCLCHGLLGNADILLSGWQILGPEFDDGLRTARAVANARIARDGEEDISRTCGIESYERPGLMLGMAGMGHYYLRMYKHSTLSVLSLVMRCNSIS